MFDLWKLGLLAVTTVYQAIATYREDQQMPPGKLVDVGGYRLHYYLRGEAPLTIVLDHSLGGVEGYFLVEELSKLAQVWVYDRAGYGWSDSSPYPRHSQQIVQELDTLLTKAGVNPPYLLVGDSFGSYSVRLYAHLFPEKVAGMVLTDGLHETEMLQMPLGLRLLKLFFISGFLVSVLGATLGIIRLCQLLGLFEILKPELRRYPPQVRWWVERSFCRPRHWLTMTREMLNLEISAAQVRKAQDFGNLPIVSIKAQSFFKPSWWTIFIPLGGANRLRDRMHQHLSQLSQCCQQLEAPQSGHFVWLDQPEVMIQSVKMVIAQILGQKMG